MLCNRHSLDLRVFFPLMLETWNCAWNSNTKKVCWCMYYGDNYIIQCDTFKFYILYLHEFFFVIFDVTLQVRWFILKMVSIELSGPPSYLCLWDSQTRELQCPSLRSSIFDQFRGWGKQWHNPQDCVAVKGSRVIILLASSSLPGSSQVSEKSKTKDCDWLPLLWSLFLDIFTPLPSCCFRGAKRSLSPMAAVLGDVSLHSVLLH